MRSYHGIAIELDSLIEAERCHGEQLLDDEDYLAIARLAMADPEACQTEYPDEFKDFLWISTWLEGA